VVVPVGISMSPVLCPSRRAGARRGGRGVPARRWTIQSSGPHVECPGRTSSLRRLHACDWALSEQLRDEVVCVAHLDIEPSLAPLEWIRAGTCPTAGHLLLSDSPRCWGCKQRQRPRDSVGASWSGHTPYMQQWLKADGGKQPVGHADVADTAPGGANQVPGLHGRGHAALR
jgi:hypothetical protein